MLQRNHFRHIKIFIEFLASPEKLIFDKLRRKLANKKIFSEKYFYDTVLNYKDYTM